MKAIIENFVQYTGDDYSYSLKQFNNILEVINTSTDEKSLRVGIEELKMKFILNFSIGFGSSHMWVHQDDVKDRLLFVQL